ncbi:LURP-one-related 8 [Musa troglodytarum]|uniref:LURP-one-related 8 n=1 Tax=Musa troglodytarum TaxID=320322 RepID=A0A9E7JY27_9LILI|nr:LURP-one-related 8 [Musa troglodytarum]
MTRKVHPNAAVPAREPPSIASCRGGDDVWGKDSAAVLTVWRKSLLFSCSGFTVFDAKGDLVFRVDTYGSGTAGELVLMDAAGKPLLTVRRKRLSLGENWLIYDGEDAGNPLYSVRKHVNLRRGKALAHVTPSRGDSGGGYEVEGSYSRRSCTVFDERGRAVAEVQQKEAIGGVAFGGEVFRLVVQPDVNACLAMAVLIVLDQMF